MVGLGYTLLFFGITIVCKEFCRLLCFCCNPKPKSLSSEEQVREAFEKVEGVIKEMISSYLMEGNCYDRSCHLAILHTFPSLGRSGPQLQEQFEDGYQIYKECFERYENATLRSQNENNVFLCAHQGYKKHLEGLHSQLNIPRSSDSPLSPLLPGSPSSAIHIPRPPNPIEDTTTSSSTSY